MNAPSRHVRPQKAGEAVFLRKAKRGAWRANVAREGLAATGGGGGEKRPSAALRNGTLTDLWRANRIEF